MYILYIHITLTIELCLQTYQYHILSDEFSGIQLFGWPILTVNCIWNRLDGIPLSMSDRVFWEFLLRKESKICLWSEPEGSDLIRREKGGSKSPASFSLLSDWRCRVIIHLKFLAVNHEPLLSFPWFTFVRLFCDRKDESS